MEQFQNSNSNSSPSKMSVTHKNKTTTNQLQTQSSQMYQKILLLGLKRSGKTSIERVVFHKMPPNETLFLENTSKIVKHVVDHAQFVKYHIWDFPGSVDFSDIYFEQQQIFDNCASIIYVIDAQDEYREALQQFFEIVAKATSAASPNANNIKFEIFIHKVDGLSEETLMDTQREIAERINYELFDAVSEGYGTQSESPANYVSEVTFHLTSIYDHSIFEALSKVVQKLIYVLPSLGTLLNICVQKNRIEKVFLFDVKSKIYLASDSSPTCLQSYEICYDMIDVVLDVSSIYGHIKSVYDIEAAQSEIEILSIDDGACQKSTNSGGNKSDTDQSSSKNGSVNKFPSCQENNKSYRSMSVHLNNDTILYLKRVNDSLALASIFRKENFVNRGVVDRNFDLVCESIQKIFVAQLKYYESQQEQQTENITT